MSTIDTIREILEHKGTTPTDMELEENYRISVDGFEDLVIEKIGDDRLSIGQ